MHQISVHDYYYQDGNGDGTKEPYAGIDRRCDTDRGEALPEGFQAVLEALDKRIANCKDNCIFPKDFKRAAQKAAGTLAELGDNSYYKGIDNLRDNYKESRSFFSWLGSTKAIVWRTIITVVVIGALSWFVIGFIQKIKSGM